MARPTRFTKEMIDYYTKQGWWDERMLSDLLDRSAELHPDKGAFVAYNVEKKPVEVRRATFRQMKQMIDRLALGFLEMGFKHDDAIICQLPNCLESFAVRMAVEKAGLLKVRDMFGCPLTICVIAIIVFFLGLTFIPY